MLTQKLPFLLPSRFSPVAWPLKRKGYLLPFLFPSFSACDPRRGEIRKKTAFASPGPYRHSTEVGKKSSSKKVKESVCVTREVRCNREEKEKWVFLLAAIPAVLRKFEPKPSSPFSTEIKKNSVWRVYDANVKFYSTNVLLNGCGKIKFYRISSAWPKKSSTFRYTSSHILRTVYIFYACLIQSSPLRS